MSLTIDEVIERNLFRENVYNYIPKNSEKILDFGCNEGALLLRLKRDKGCSGLYGIELRESAQESINTFLDGAWNMNIEEESACLGEEYIGFFNYIVMHDVVEHLYDPWYVLAKLRKYLAPGGRLVVVTPNFQFWGLWSMAMRGEFLYGTGGLMNEEHIRWFSSFTLMELLQISGFKAIQRGLLYPPGTDISILDKSKAIFDFSLPPKELKANGHWEGVKEVNIKFPNDIRDDYELLLANKLFMIAEKSDYEPLMKRIEYDELKVRREHYKEYYKNQSTPKV